MLPLKVPHPLAVQSRLMWLLYRRRISLSTINMLAGATSSAFRNHEAGSHRPCLVDSAEDQEEEEDDEDVDDKGRGM